MLFLIAGQDRGAWVKKLIRLIEDELKLTELYWLRRSPIHHLWFRKVLLNNCRFQFADVLVEVLLLP